MVSFYFDEHMPIKVSDALREKGYTVVRAVEVGLRTKADDEDHLPYATEHQLVLVTFDHPFASRTEARPDFYAMLCLPHKFQGNNKEIIKAIDAFGQLFDESRDIGTVTWW